MRRRLPLLFAIASVMALWTAAISADTLVLRNGQRISGRLIGLRNGVFEFEEDRGFRRRTIRVEQADVRTIELDTDDGRPRIEPGRPDDDRDRDRTATRPRGLRERDVLVAARSPWTDTGIQVRSGQMIYFEASGRIRWGQGRQDGPEGENDSPRNPSRPIPARPAAALIARIGDDAPFFIGGDTAGIRMRGSGTLFLGVNDDSFEDNSGSFRVTIYY